MRFSKSIVKLGKAQILNGKVDRSEIVTLYFSKSGNKVYTKEVSINNQMGVFATKEPLNFTEILPVNENITLTRRGESIGVWNE